MEGTIRNQEPRATVIEERAATTVTPTWPGILNRISLSAIIAGVAVALVFQVALNLLGVSIGANAINPLTQQNPIDTRLALPAVLWIVLSAAISLFAGGFVAAYMAGTVRREDGIMHGVSTWAIASIISLFLLSSTVGNILGTASNVLGQGLSLAGSAAADLSPAVADALNLQNIRLDTITQEAQDILGGTQTTATTSGTATDTTTPDTTGNNTTTDQLTPQQRELNFDITRLLMTPADDANLSANRDTVVNALVDQGGMTPEQAQQTVTTWETNFAEVRAQAEETARQVGQTIADTVAALAGVVFMMMIVSLAGAVFGGYAGISPVTTEDVAVTRRTTQQRPRVNS